MMETKNRLESEKQVITASQLLAHWQGHRQLTRRVIEAFPEDKLFTYSIGGMRNFAEMVMELLAIAGPGMIEIVTGETQALNEHFDHQNSKKLLLEKWDEATKVIDENWAKLPLSRFQESIKAFGQYEGSVQSSIFYFIDNEIHHRGQAYVYLRALGVEPPLFWER